jgi:RNA polymerase sigma-54 factor
MHQRMDTRQLMAPRMIQSMEILQMATMALQEKIQQELQENPVLELRQPEAPYTPEESTPAGNGVEDDPGRKELVIDEQHGNEKDFDRLEAMSKDYEDAFNEEHRPSRSGIEEAGDKKHDAMQNMADRPPSLQDHLDEQLAFLDLAPEQVSRVRYLMSHLDDNGYLGHANEKDEYVPYTLEELAGRYEVPVTPAELEDALNILQKLDPPGVGARDLKECLLLQLTPETPYADLLRALILNHLEDIQHNRLPVIQKRTGADLEEIHDAIEALRHLNPRPAAGFHVEPVQYVVPDILVERTEKGDYEVRLLDDWLPRISISKRYLELVRNKEGDKNTRAYLKQKIQKALWLQDSIEQRRNTLERVTKAIIKHQHEFLEHGPEYIEPLKMQQIADQVGVHVTTVSRAVDDKWVQTPRGIFPLKRFFGGGKEIGGEEVAWEKIKGKMLEIIHNEDKSNPLSDEDLVTKLQEAGYPVARRTVTKYRKALKIPSSRQRKDWTVQAPKAAVISEQASVISDQSPVISHQKPEEASISDH